MKLKRKMNEKTKLILQDLLQDWQDSSVNDVNSINEQQQKNIESFFTQQWW